MEMNKELPMFVRRLALTLEDKCTGWSIKVTEPPKDLTEDKIKDDCRGFVIQINEFVQFITFQEDMLNSTDKSLIKQIADMIIYRYEYDKRIL